MQFEGGDGTPLAGTFADPCTLFGDCCVPKAAVGPDETSCRKAVAQRLR